jgi:hypothetical protein
MARWVSESAMRQHQEARPAPETTCTAADGDISPVCRTIAIVVRVCLPWLQDSVAGPRGPVYFDWTLRAKDFCRDALQPIFTLGDLLLDDMVKRFPILSTTWLGVDILNGFLSFFVHFCFPLSIALLSV